MSATHNSYLRDSQEYIQKQVLGELYKAEEELGSLKLLALSDFIPLTCLCTLECHSNLWCVQAQGCDGDFLQSVCHTLYSDKHKIFSVFSIQKLIFTERR